MSFASGVDQVKRSYFYGIFKEFKKCVEVSGTFKFHVNVAKSCIVNFCYCSLTDAFKGLRANFLTSSYFSMKLSVRTSKMLFNTRASQTKK